MVSIIIPTLGRTSIERLLRSVLRAARQSGLRLNQDLEVIVCIDRRGLLKLASEFDEVRVIPSEGVGVNHARNSGARASRGNIFWFLDDDTEICHDESLTDLPRMFADSDLCAIGGDYLSTPKAGFGERGYNSMCSLWRVSAGVPEAEQLLGGTLAVRASAWKAVGGFDERIEYGGAETSFVARLNNTDERRLGRVEFHELLNVWHSPGNRGFAGWVRVATLQGRRKIETAKSLPGFSKRTTRALDFLVRQEARTLISLACFGIAFLTVSKMASFFRR